MILICAAVAIALTMGIRHTFGLFLAPMTSALGWGREVFALGLAIQNIVWGAAQPFAGMLADRYGSGKVIFTAALLYALGVFLMGHSGSGAEFGLTAGLLIGLGLSGSTFSVLFAVVGRAVAPEQRTTALTLVSTAGSLGQFLMVPAGQALIDHSGWLTALTIMGAMALLVAPASLILAEPGNRSGGTGNEQTVREALAEAFKHNGFRLLTLGYFVCGFQVVFIGTHLPAFLIDRGLDAGVGMTALALVGLFNIFGTYAFGRLGERFGKKYLLALLYFARSVVIATYLLLPVTAFSTYVFACAIGFLWLSTVPLTNGLVVQIFGVKYLGMLSGFVFFSHQLGSFFGAWLGGYIFDATGAYTLMWIIAIALGVIAAVINVPIDERPAASMRRQAV
jgi:predicted MFS family arabinose efflux permease